MSDDTHLYWSRRGEIACAKHAPRDASERWVDEAWQPMPDFGVRMARYQCQHCEGVPLKSFPRLDGNMPLILNVDDRPASLYVRNRALRMHGFTVANAGTGRDAIEFARRLNPHLVLLDVHLPDIDGRKVCQVLKNDRETASIPVMLISSTLGERGEDLYAQGALVCDAYLAEPVDAEDLASAVRRLLRAS
jgi:CheY-like chemotaxis protein